MTRGEDFNNRRNCEIKHCSSKSNSVLCDLDAKRDTLNLHEVCSNPRSLCQKRITSIPRQFQLEGAGFKNTKKNLKDVKKLVTQCLRQQ